MTNDEAKSLAIELQGYGYKIPEPVTKEWLAKAYERGMIPKKDLVNGAIYIGCCRNAYLAQWHAEKNCFVHLRTKFDNVFAEEINHPEDDDGFDLFVPTLKVFVQE